MIDAISPTSKILLSVIIILVIIWLLYMIIKTKYIPDGSFRDTYENMIISAHRKYDHIFQNPNTLYNNTIGYENDKIVEMALKKSIRQEKLHTRNENKNRLSHKHVNDAVTSAFITGNLLRYNVAENTNPNTRDTILNNVNQYYNRALNRIHNNPGAAIVERDTNRPRLEHIINTISEFYNERNIPIDVSETRNRLRKARIIEAGNADTYFSPKHIRSDPQNVHDSNVTSDIYKKFTNIKLKNLSENKFSDPNELFSVIKNDSSLSNEQKSRANKTLDYLFKGHPITSLHSDGTEVLSNIWARINSSENEPVKEQLTKSLIDSLINSNEKNSSGEYKLACTTGVCSRVIDSLTLLDTDSDISSPIKNTEILRNEIFSKAHKVMKDTISAASADYQQAYNSTKTDPDTLDKISKLEIRILNNIDSIRLEYPNTNSDILNTIIDDAKAGI